MIKKRELTISEFARLGGLSTAHKYPGGAKEWGKKGQQALKAKYGGDLTAHYQKMRLGRANYLKRIKMEQKQG